MKNYTTQLLSIAMIALGAIFCSQGVLAQGEVTRSGSTWSARVNGNTVYTGNRMFDAVNAACNNMGAGTINIRNSGDSGNDGGNVYAIRPRANQTLDFHGHTVNCNSNGHLVVAVHADRRDGITVRNLRVTGNPRYGIWFRGCSNVTLTNITMNLNNNSPVGLGIRVDASTGPASNLTINGTTTVTGSAGHGIETYSVNGVSIGDVTVNNTGGCGVLLNDSDNCTVGVVTGNYNNQGGGYATFRVANNNRSTHCEGVYSRNSGRGFFSVSGSRDCTIDWVDIANTTSHGIFLEDATNTHILSGSVSGGSPNCQEVRTSNCSINVSGCGGSGGGGGNNGTINGVYSIVASHSGKALDTYNWGTTDGTNIVQWNYWGGQAQQFNITPVDGEWHRITPVIATSKAIDVDGISTANGANIHIWNYWGGHGQQFRFQSAGTGLWRIIARHSGKCLDVEGSSSNDGANVIQWECISGAQNQMFSLDRVSGSRLSASELTENGELSIYPNPVVEELNIELPKQFQEGAELKVFNVAGKLVIEEKIKGSSYRLQVNGIPAGVYMLKLSSQDHSLTSKFTRR